MNGRSLEERTEAVLTGDARGPSEPLLRPVSITNLASAELVPPRFVIDPLVPRRAVTLFGGHGGSGKSLLALILAAHVATGRVWAGFSVERGRALFVSLEDEGDLVRFRLRRIAEVYSLDLALLERNLEIVDGTASGIALAGEINDAGSRHLGVTAAFHDLQLLAQGADLIVVDNASDAFDGNENDRRMVRAFVRHLTAIALSADAGMVLLAHIDKAAAKFGAQGNNYSGSTAWHNSARSRLALVDDAGRVELRQEKLNLGAKAEPVSLRWAEGGVLVPLGSAGEFSRDREDADAVFAALQSAWAQGIELGAARTGSSTAFSVLSTFDGLPKHLKKPSDGAAFWAALNRLHGTGKIRTETVTTKHRKPRDILVQNGAPNALNGFGAHSTHTPQTPAPNKGVGGVGDWRAQNSEQIHSAQLGRTPTSTTGGTIDAGEVLL